MAGCVKFNIDGSARGKLGPAGCGGVLRDEMGRVLALFSGPLGVLDSNEAELYAILFALESFRTLQWGALPCIVESDSLVATLWVGRGETRPWRLYELFRRVDDACLGMTFVFNHVVHEVNGVADILAKGRVDRKAWLRIGV
ncbi:hypothetical protein HRI_004565300 [Hibiscus trionum]|uniref:RNase H type-1 domain-containing protein n=1 Tax=Hibiscus trionum TaxID=183268 RepID=A0A9W7J5G9_HIBTR|nr:hypothetical protein HRI_004565300 [Hibiscus trionum]